MGPSPNQHADGGVERLRHRDEGRRGGVEALQQLHEVGWRTGEPTDLVDDDKINLPLRKSFLKS